MKSTKIPPVHPGEILLGDFMEPLGLTPEEIRIATARAARQLAQR